MTGFEEIPLGRTPQVPPSTFWFDYFNRLLPNDDMRIGPGRWGGQALTNTLGGGGKSYLIPVTAFLNDAVIGFAYKYSVGGKKSNIVMIQDLNFRTGAHQMQLVLTKLENDTLAVRMGDWAGNYTILGVSDQPLLPNRYYYIEWSFTYNNASSFTNLSTRSYNNTLSYARTQIIIDNVVTYDSGDSQSLSLNFPILEDPANYLGYSVDVPYYGVPQQFVSLCYDHFQMVNCYDDFYILSNAFVRDSGGTLITGTGPYLPLSESNVRTMLPSLTAGPTARNNWINVDNTTNPTPTKAQSVQQADVFPTDETYITQTTTGSTQTFTFDAVKTGTDTIYGVQPTAVAKAGTYALYYTIRAWNFWIGTSGGHVIDDTQASGAVLHESSYHYAVQCFPAWPVEFNTNAAWTEAQLNSLEFGPIIAF